MLNNILNMRDGDEWDNSVNFKRFIKGRVKVHYSTIKECIDVFVSLTALILLSPLMLAIALAVKLTSPGPILYWSNRRGLNGDVFSMPKFRTMTVCSKLVSREIASTEDVTLTPIGRFLRKTSLDELPQLFAVLTGKMSLVGPRPLIVNDFAEAARQEHSVIYNVKPGITGLAQVNGRNFISVSNKTRYDKFYANRFCMILDIKIILRTMIVLFKTDMVK